MAGAGYKLFATGDVLTAAQVNTYLNEQTVMVFADSAARTTALSGVLAEGMMSYLQDTDSVEVYNGTAWTTVGAVAVEDYAAGKNKIINGDFYINQRVFSSTTTDGTFGFDRWFMQTADGTGTYSTQAFTPGAAPVAGYEGKNFARLVTTGQTLSSAETSLRQRIEDVRTLAGQTATISFYAKAATGTPKIAIELRQDFGSGGSTAVNTYAGQVTLSTSWARYSVTISVPSISGKTIGTNGFLGLHLFVSAGTDFNARTGSLGIQSNTFDMWGVQVEAASVPSAFQTATGTLQGELAACQRYFLKSNNQSEAPGAAPTSTPINAINASTTLIVGVPPFKVNMRVAPSVILYSPVTGTTGKVRSGGADRDASAADIGEYTIGYISATGLSAGSNSAIAFAASAEL